MLFHCKDDVSVVSYHGYLLLLRRTALQRATVSIPDPLARFRTRKQLAGFRARSTICPGLRLQVAKCRMLRCQSSQKDMRCPRVVSSTLAFRSAGLLNPRINLFGCVSELPVLVVRVVLLLLSWLLLISSDSSCLRFDGTYANGDFENHAFLKLNCQLCGPVARLASNRPLRFVRAQRYLRLRKQEKAMQRWRAYFRKCRS